MRRTATFRIRRIDELRRQRRRFPRTPDQPSRGLNLVLLCRRMATNRQVAEARICFCSAGNFAGSVNFRLRLRAGLNPRTQP